LCCLSFGLRFWLPLWYLVTIVLSVLLRFRASDFPFGILWPLYCLSFFGLGLLITPLVSCGHCVACPSTYGLITPLVSCGHCVVCPSSVYGFWLSFGILWPLCCLSFGLRLLITPLVSCDHCGVCPSSV
jgi:hypothetical protein